MKNFTAQLKFIISLIIDLIIIKISVINKTCLSFAVRRWYLGFPNMEIQDLYCKSKAVRVFLYSVQPMGSQ